jgi:hypothetical protein
MYRRVIINIKNKIIVLTHDESSSTKTHFVADKRTFPLRGDRGPAKATTQPHKQSTYLSHNRHNYFYFTIVFTPIDFY